MKRSDLKELIKKSMLEVSPKSGAMTPEEEKMVAGYEEEEANKYALDNERPLEEALNKDIKAFGQDLDKAFKAAGFDTLILMQGPSAEQMNIVKTNPKAVLFLVTETRATQTLVVYVNPKQIQKAESIINKFQLSDFDGPVLTRGWTAKQVQGAINPGDIVKQDNEKDKGTWYFYRLAQVDTKVKSMEEASVILNRDEVYAKYAPLVKQYMKNGLDKHAAISKAQDVLAKEYGATPLNIQSTISDYFDDQDRNSTYANENVLREADDIVAAYAKKKLVKEALDFPRDAVQALADAYKNIEKIYSTFGRDSRFKDEAKQDDYLMIKATLQSINNKLVGLDSDFGYGQGAKLGYEGLNEEMHGGYLELLEMNPDFEQGARLLLNAWFEWKEGPMTEPQMVEEAKQDILAYLSSMMK